MKIVSNIKSLFVVSSLVFFLLGCQPEQNPTLTPSEQNPTLTPYPSLELLADVPADHIQAIRVRDAAPNEILFAVTNLGADCGGGAPASVWKITFDSHTGQVNTISKKQDLKQIQEVRRSLFETSDGTLFVGGGWCGYKPPYYSTDGGETWQPADSGKVSPPNSTFSYAEFNGEVYAGTGYEPYNGQVYRWLGQGNWKLVLDIAPPRSIVNSMAVYNKQLFVSSLIYGWDGNGCETSTPVYVSEDSNNYTSTTGIPPCSSVQQLLIANGQLTAWVDDYQNPSQQSVYRWDGSSWKFLGPLGLDKIIAPLKAAVNPNGTIYSYSRGGIYQSADLGLTWQKTVSFPRPDVEVTALHFYDQTLYLGTDKDSDNIAYVYRMTIRQ